MTHNFLRDKDYVRSLLDSPARFIAMLGPGARTQRLLTELREEGAAITDQNLERIHGFAAALADRYSGRHAGYPAVRLFSAWNEPNLEQFLAPQFDEAGRSVGPELYAPIARAIYDGVKQANPDAFVAVTCTRSRFPTSAVATR